MITGNSITKGLNRSSNDQMKKISGNNIDKLVGNITENNQKV